jgi:hypothetical protein
LVEGVEVQNQHLKCMDVEKEITNITIKYTPVELADITICTYMSQFDLQCLHAVRLLSANSRTLNLPNVVKFGTVGAQLTIRMYLVPDSILVPFTTNV